MSDPIPLLTSIGQAMATMVLYGENHPARKRAVQDSFEELLELASTNPRPQFSFLGGEVVYDRRVLRELKEWEWAARFAAVGIERIEFTDEVTFEEYERFLTEAYQRVSRQETDTSEARQMGRPSIRFGAIRLTGGDAARLAPAAAVATITYSLKDEVEGINWLHERVADAGALPLLETETIVRSLALAMHAERRMVLPLLQLKEFDQYTTTHSSNVAVLAMGLAEHLGMGPREVRAVGVAGLLHDLGKVRIPKEILLKPGLFTEGEHKVMQAHPVEGAKIILEQHAHLDLAAVVAYEHHLMFNGTGYPTFRYPRETHYVSAMIHVCDVYDALCTDRPYREAWMPEAALALIEEQTGVSFEPDLTAAFAGMIRESAQQRVAVEHPTVAIGSPTESLQGIDSSE